MPYVANTSAQMYFMSSHGTASNASTLKFFKLLFKKRLMIFHNEGGPFALCLRGFPPSVAKISSCLCFVRVQSGNCEALTRVSENGFPFSSNLELLRKLLYPARTESWGCRWFILLVDIVSRAVGLWAPDALRLRDTRRCDAKTREYVH